MVLNVEGKIKKRKNKHPVYTQFKTEERAFLVLHDSTRSFQMKLIKIMQFIVFAPTEILYDFDLKNGRFIHLHI